MTVAKAALGGIDHGSDGNRRLYGTDHLKRLAFIRHARDLGFDVDAIRALLDLQDNPGHPCSPADSIAQLRLEEVKTRISKRTALKVELEKLNKHPEEGLVMSNFDLISWLDSKIQKRPFADIIREKVIQKK